MSFERSDLANDYSWTALREDDPKITGEPDSTLLNRNEGYEVLRFIQKFMRTHGLKNENEGRKIERMIHDHPGRLRSHDHVIKWIVDNWSKY